MHNCEDFRERIAEHIIDREDLTSDPALQLELLIERKLRQRALLADREAAKDGAGGRHRERDGKDEADGDRSDLEHGEAELQELLFTNTPKMLNNTPLAVREITHRAGLPRL